MGREQHGEMCAVRLSEAHSSVSLTCSQFGIHPFHCFCSLGRNFAKKVAIKDQDDLELVQTQEPKWLGWGSFLP